jgi:hypothetical protein
MILTHLLFALVPAAAPSDLLAIRVGRAETVSKGVIEHAVILVEGGKIVTIGEDLPVERGIPVLDRPEWTAIPGLVNAYSRLGLDGEGGDDVAAEVKASSEIWHGAEEYEKVVEYGVTTLGLYPPGNGIPGQAVAVRPLAKSNAEMVLRDPAYLKVVLRANSASKKALSEGFKKADDYAEKEKKAREKWEKDQEKKKKPAAKKDEKKDEKKDDPKPSDEKKEEPKSAAQEPGEDDAGVAQEKKEEAKKEPAAASDAYVPPEPDAKTKPFLDLRSGKLRALVSVGSAGEFLHLVDAVGKETFAWDLRIPVSRELDVFYVLTKKEYELEVDGIGDRKVRTVVEPTLTVHPGTMRTRNPAAELSRAGAKLVLIPRNDSLPDHRMWLANVGEVVGAGLDRDVALRAMTLEAAALLGVDDRLGSLEKGKDANLVLLDGDPFEPSTKIQAVMLEGRFVHGEANL